MIYARATLWLTAVVTVAPLHAQTQSVATPVPTGRLSESPLSTATLLETAVGLLLVLGLILGLAWLVRRMGRLPGPGKGAVQIVGGVSLGPRERAVVLSVEGVRLLVGVAPGRVQTLYVLGADQGREADAKREDVVPFGERLDQAVRAGGEG